MPNIGVLRLGSRKQRARKPLASDLAALHDLSHNELKERWSDLFGSTCPPGMSRNILVRAIAYQLQEWPSADFAHRRAAASTEPRLIWLPDETLRRSHPRSSQARASFVNGKGGSMR